MKNKNIAIDGPSGAGKSTLAWMLAKLFGYIYVDTGAIYRCVGLYALEHGLDSKDEKAVVASLDKINIEMKYDDAGVQKMYLNGEDVSEKIRLPEVSIYASDVSAMPDVRAFLLEMQRSAARRDNVVMDGRDIGTVVLPDAGVKIFLTASSKERARRRLRELLEKGVKTDFDEVLRDIEYRDENDSSRAAAPLKAADDAVVFDSSDVGLNETFEALKKIVEERLSDE